MFLVVYLVKWYQHIFPIYPNNPFIKSEFQDPKMEVYHIKKNIFRAWIPENEPSFEAQNMGDTSNLGSWNGHFSRQKRRLHPLSPARMNCCWHLAAKTWLLPRGDSAIKHGNLTIKQWGFNLRVKHWDLAIKNGAWIIKDCDLIIKHVVPQLIKNGGSAIKNQGS